MDKKKTIVLLCSLSFITASIGYSAWVNEFKYEYSENNKVQDRPVAYIIGREDIKYTSIEKALDVAQSGDIVSIIPPNDENYNSNQGSTIPDKVIYEISKNCIVKPGVTLVIPTDKNSFSGVKDQNSLNQYVKTMSTDDRNRGGNYGANARKDEKHYLRATIKIKDGVTLTNQGTIIVSGYLSGGNNSSGIVGQTTHSYTQIVLGRNSKILQDNSNAEFRCYGFVHEEENNNGSRIDLTQGKLYLPLIIYDYRGFSFSFAMTVDAMSTYHASPFNDFGVENIEPFTKISSQANVYGISNLYVSYSNPSVSQNFYNEILLASTQKNAFINFTSGNSSLETKIDKISKKNNFGFIGGMKLNSILIKMDAGIASINLDTKDSYLPVSYRYNIYFRSNDGQTSFFDCTNQRIKFLPGSSCTMQENTNITFSDLIIYSAFSDGSTYSLKNVSFGRSEVYPIKNGAVFIMENSAFLTANSVAGVIYSDVPVNIKYTLDSVTSYEPWNVKSNSQLTRPWTIDEYLLINEKLNIHEIAFLDKQKIYFGVNVFNSKKDIVPEVILHLNDSTINETISGYQKVVFVDKFINYKIELKNNIYRIYNGKNLYEKDSLVSGDGNNFITAINSLLYISDNNNGTNEFDVQSVKITCETPLIDNKVPLYPDANILLKANVVDINKVYNPVVKRTSSDSLIATIDNNGKVLGKKLGKVSFTATCNGVSDTFETEVINKGQIVPITSITISDNIGNTATLNTGTSNLESFTFSKKYENKKNYPISLKLNDGAKWSSIEWKFNASDAGRQYLNDKTLASETVNNTEQVTIHVVSGSGATDDQFSLQCKVTDFEGNVFTLKLTLIHKADKVCIVEGTQIRMADGTVKKVEDLEIGDELLVFNHFSGKLESSKLFFNYHANESNIVTSNILNLEFEQGIFIKVHIDHGFFDIDKNGYFYINIQNYKTFIGDRFVVVNDDLSLSSVKLLRAFVKRETVRVYSPVSINHLNVITNDLLSITGEIEGWFNFFEYDKNLRYKEESITSQIKRYGLYDYDFFKKYISKYVFENIPIKYLKISVGKGITTIDKIIFVMQMYLSDK